MIERPKTEQEPNPEDASLFSLRPARSEDLAFLFKASTEAMRPVSEARNPRTAVGSEEKFATYKANFDQEKIQVIQYRGQDVGRLRIVRSDESIYVGGIQILPEFQNKGIGTNIFSQLKEESRQSGLPIVLEVHDVNAAALSFYKGLGFEEDGKTGDQTIMRFTPTR